ncbi:hypothetical protein B0H13DRAFT_1624451 [Mycena leptocephala]|nr:hypothetical protein B0H13DRAFT_1624451 [Mycena leptocephala]
MYPFDRPWFPEQPAEPPVFDPSALEILYFDLYGTLVDNEWGILDALGPLLTRCPRQLDKHEALTFYFESEDEAEMWSPNAPYFSILAEAHEHMTIRLGPTVAGGASAFASSLFTWPFFDGALRCLQTSSRAIPTLVALFDIDFFTFSKISAFSSLTPYFAEVFTWDAAQAYRPKFRAFAPPIPIPRRVACAACAPLPCLEQPLPGLGACMRPGVPTIWMRHPPSLTRHQSTLHRGRCAMTFVSWPR